MTKNVEFENWGLNLNQIVLMSNQYLTNSSQEQMGDLGDKPIVFKNKWGIHTFET